MIQDQIYSYRNGWSKYQELSLFIPIDQDEFQLLLNRTKEYKWLLHELNYFISLTWKATYIHDHWS